jgi:hypothetical protein
VNSHYTSTQVRSEGRVLREKSLQKTTKRGSSST